MKQAFDQGWNDWVETNLARHCERDGIFKVLLDNGFDYYSIAERLGYHPKLNPYLITNPLTGVRILASDMLPSSQLFLPNAERLDDERLELYVVDDFLSAEECSRIVGIMCENLELSTLTNDLEPDQYYRTSKTCDLGRLDDPFIQEIDRRICHYLGINPDFSEGLQAQYYDVGEEFKEHTDYFEAVDWDKHCVVQGQRSYTFMIYLNDTEAGGETRFTVIDRSFSPKTGTAVIWNSLNADGTVNPSSMHWGMPVQKGFKAIITKWFRMRGRDATVQEMSSKGINEYVPNYTRTGFEKKRLPQPLFDKILTFLEQNRNMTEREDIPGDFVYRAGEAVFKRGSELVSLSDELRNEIHDTLKPMLEAWSNTELEPTYVYGIRIYRDQAVLKMHRDRVDTHIISAIINVDQEVREDWPLVIEDNYYRQHHVSLEPGDIVFYEGARLEHGRPIPLQGDSYANIFTHFKPVGYVKPDIGK